MRRSSTSRRARGFTLIELLVVLVVLALAMGLGIPAIKNMVLRSRLEGMGQELSVLVQRSRLEAIKRRVPTVVEVDPVAGTAVAWADVDGPAVGDPPDLLFNPVAGEPRFTTDFEISHLEPRPNVAFAAPAAEPVIAGLSVDPNGRQVLVFLPTGAADAAGAFRIADGAGLNHLEVRVEPAGTGRVELRKWDRELAAWAGRREGGRPWEWYTEP